MDILIMLIIVVIVSLIASAILSGLAKGKEKKDKGFAFGYHRLTHRRRLIRTLWLLPLNVLLLLWIDRRDVLTPVEFNAIVVLFAIIMVGQSAYEYVKWKREEKKASLRIRK